MTRTACITTPIYYVNDRPHIGHIFTTTLCDAWARAMRLQNCDVFFLTGTDEHGVKVEKSAAEHNVTPQAWADTNAAEFERILPLFQISNTDFIRTTQPRHERQVQEFIQRLQKSGALYKGSFEGWYDEGQEEYLTETRAKECEYKSAVNGKPLVRAQEQNWYFKLSAFSDRLKAHFESHPHFVQPSARMNEVVGRLREGLQDVPMTRTNFTWGIPMPGDPGHVIYVWIDALFNYITALDYTDASPKNPRAQYWPADWHVIAKDRAHTIKTAIKKNVRSKDISTPGHIFPLIAKDGGVLERAGHTEASVDIAKLSGCGSSGVICEIMNSDGSMAKGKNLFNYAKKFNLNIARIEDLIAYRLKKESLIKLKRVEQVKIGKNDIYQVKIYENKLDGKDHNARIDQNIMLSLCLNPYFIKVYEKR